MGNGSKEPRRYASRARRGERSTEEKKGRYLRDPTILIVTRALLAAPWPLAGPSCQTLR